MARRSSYASVLSGAAATSSPSFQQPARSGAFSQLASSPQAGAVSHSYPPQHHSRHSEPSHPQAYAESLQQQEGLSHHSSSLSHYWDTAGSAMADPRPGDLFIPSYLRGTPFVEQLEERHKTRAASQRDGRSGRLSNGGSLSTSSSSMNLQKMVPSHRGMTYDIQESHPYTRPEDVIPSLPSRWSVTDKFGGLELNADGTEVKFTGTSKTQDEAAAVRSDHPMPKECGIYYFEVTVLSKGKEGLIGVGFSGAKVALNRLPGWEPDSWAYHGDDGYSFCQTASAKSYGPRFGSSDVIGCGVNFKTGCAFFTKNGVNLGTAFRDLKGLSPLYPSVGMKKPGEHIRVNFGQTPFVFDIDGMMRKERMEVHREIDAEDTSPLHGKGTESSLLQGLVAQYLAQEGYIETAKAFAEEAHTSAKLLRGETASAANLDYKEDLDANKRQRIRSAVLDGDVDRALKLTNAYYPSVLQQNGNIYFKLRCRKFIEMIRKYTDLASAGSKAKRRHSSNGGLAFGTQKAVTNGHSHNEQTDKPDFPDVFDGQQMELDDTSPMEMDGMEIEDTDTLSNGKSTENEYDLMNAALQYGQELRSEFKDDPRREVKQALEDTFALIAYSNARESSLAPMLDESHRIPVAEELNSAILVSLGKSSSSALERMIGQTEVMVKEMAHDGGSAAFVNVRSDYLR